MRTKLGWAAPRRPLSCGSGDARQRLRPTGLSVGVSAAPEAVAASASLRAKLGISTSSRLLARCCSPWVPLHSYSGLFDVGSGVRGLRPISSGSVLEGSLREVGILGLVSGGKPSRGNVISAERGRSRGPRVAVSVCLRFLGSQDGQQLLFRHVSPSRAPLEAGRSLSKRHSVHGASFQRARGCSGRPR